MKREWAVQWSDDGGVVRQECRSQEEAEAIASRRSTAVVMRGREVVAQWMCGRIISCSLNPFEEQGDAEEL
jgi:hypothetical protein